MKLLGKITTNRVQARLHAILHITLAMFLVICMIELYITITMESKFPYKKIYPELEMRPIINATSKKNFIWYDENDVSTVDKCIKSTDDFFEAYRMHPEPANIAPVCDFENPPKKGQTCPLDLDNFGPCAAPFYGYYSFSPCIFLKLSKIYGWKPRYYSSLDKLPPSMPKDLVNAIRKVTNTHAYENKQVWVSCEGEHDVDKESVEAINYYPNRGFPAYYFPVKHKNDEYLSPLIAVEIVNPKPGFTINIICRAWAKNLERRNGDAGQQKVTLHFGIMREELNYQDEQYQQPA